MTRLERVAFFGVPLAVLAAAYAGICLMTGTMWPWSEVVHEDGARTLAATVFYFEHAVRELPLDIVLALGIAGAVRLLFAPGPSPSMPRLRTVLACIAGGTGLVILGVTAWRDGAQVLFDNLVQSHTRPGAPLVWGAHWRYHLVERLAQLLLAPALVYLVWLQRGGPSPAAGRSYLFGWTLALFALLTVAFGLTAEPFRDPAFLGHQLRELFTHTLVTLPLALGICLYASPREASSPGVQMKSGPATARVPGWTYLAAGSAAIVCGAFLLVASVLADAQSHGQQTGLAALLLPHFGEHFLGYVFTPALAGCVYLSTRR